MQHKLVCLLLVFCLDFPVALKVDVTELFGEDKHHQSHSNSATSKLQDCYLPSGSEAHPAVTAPAHMTHGHTFFYIHNMCRFYLIFYRPICCTISCCFSICLVQPFSTSESHKLAAPARGADQGLAVSSLQLLMSCA